MVKVEPFDEGKSRPEMLQLNHIVRECPKRAKYVSIADCQIMKRQNVYFVESSTQAIHCNVMHINQFQLNQMSYTDAAKGQGFYRNLQCKIFNIQAFEQELQYAMKMTEYIIIGGDWNAHHPAWSDHNIDDVGECTLDFIVSNGLHINTLPFDLHVHER
ncbi:hypothetical protein RFI_32584 [Reticulomyxa filosa]|uniref:Endonuclease/exonuclease/phosphatase domain-containing protein n=1 Tax=Reticulomyxa filosa TaxID=46433 RepID=X6LUK2_RETFI|nr:hypothetical protein RFI_32584 [Reticulomyxa filosa]|eukprot:ETO04812.1 hypothetical protein RFI_32584 [Reticulomyxa filosa]